MESTETKLVNHRLKLTYEEFINMGKDLQQYSIAQGGFGTVYKGFSQIHQQTIAIKVIDLIAIQNIYSGRTQKKVLGYAKTQDIFMRLCKSENIVKCYDVFENQSFKIIIMEYCEVGTLGKFIKQNGKFRQKEALRIFKQILNGIAEMHEKKIVHRDLKTQNILIKNGIMKICDLGLSKSLKQVQGKTVVGTKRYQAPQIIQKKSYGLKVDIWSAAVILYLMIFGQHPFKEQIDQYLLIQMKQSHIHRQKQITACGYTASIQMSNFLKNMFKMNPVKRYGWKQLIKHPILKQIQQNRLPRLPLIDVNLIPPSSIEQDLLQKSNQQQQTYSNLLKRVEISSRDSTDIIIKKLGKKSIQLKKKVIKTQQQILYLKINEHLIQCMKNQLIFQQIITKIQYNKILDLQEFHIIQLMYILSQRCFLNMSPIYQYFQENKQKHIFIKQTYQIIHNLYKEINNLFQKYKIILTQQQNKIFNIIKGIFGSKQEKQIRDKFFDGIEKLDYNKQQQLEFIQKKYINPVIPDLKEPSKEINKIKSYLQNYRVINLIQSKDLTKINFDAYIERIISN